MSDHDKPGVFRRIADQVEDTAEKAIRQVVRHEEHEEHEEHEGHHHTGAHEPVIVNVTVPVTVQCCPPGSPGGGGTPGGAPGRPVHGTGSSDGTVTGGITSQGGVLGVVTRPPTIWPGTRTQLFLPFLLVRANAGDTGLRPVSGVFWESPDIFVLPGVAPANAPAIPADLGGIAQAGTDNTVYAHVWNLGQAQAVDVLVEFYWFNPALSFSSDQAHLIGAVWTNLAARSQAGSHRVVKCPASWPAMYVNGGHECLVVRVSEPVTDPLAGPAWDASQNRHIAQRNIHVMAAATVNPHVAGPPGAGLAAAAPAGASLPTIGIDVGPMFGGTAQVAVSRADATTMPWLHLVTMSRGATFGTAAPTGDVGITAPVPSGSGVPNLGAVPDPRAAGLIADTQGVVGDGRQIAFYASDANPGAGSSHIYRVTGTQDGTIFGGYTVVLLGS
jgi:hypothetical protein